MTLASTVATSGVDTTGAPCVNLSSVDNLNQQMANGFLMSRGLLPCEGSSYTIGTGCVDVSVYTNPDDRTRAIEFFQLYNITMCFETVTANAMTTNSPMNDQPLCIDVSIFPVNEQQGAIVFLSLYGIQACPLTNTDSGGGETGSENCIDISRFLEEQKAVIIEIIKPATPCNDTENSSPASSSSGSASRDLCVNITLVEDSRRQMVIDFITSHNLTACEVSSETADTPPASPPNTNCVDLSIYSTPEDRARAIAFFELYNITICPETSVSSTTNAPEAATTPSVSAPLPCIDVSVFPVNEQPGAVVFLSLYGIQACPLTNSSSGAGGENSTDCVDISGFTDEQKAVIIEIIKPSVPCNNTLASTVATPGVDTTGSPCVNLSSVDNLNQQMANGFLMSRGLLPCEASSYTTGTGCVDVSVYTNPDDRTRAIEFFQLYNITMCFETVTANAMTTNSPMNDQPLCIDVSIFPVNEQQGAIVFLSLFGIQACPLTNTDSGGGGTGSENCIDISRYSEEQKAVIIEIIKPATPCNDTENSSPASSSSGSASRDLCVNITLVEDSRRQMVIDFIASHNLTACEVSSETADTPPASPPNTNCVDLSIYSTPEDRARAIAFFELYNITICPETSVLSTVNAPEAATTPSVSPSLPCIDVSVFPVNEQPGAVVFLSLYGIQACPLTNSSSGAGGENSTDCVEISGFTDEQKAVIIEIIKPSVPCNKTLAPTVATPGVDTTGAPCVNLSSVDNLNQQMANGFLMSRGLLPCEGSSYTTGTGCVDVSVYTNPDDRTKAIEFFQLYNITMCFETVTANTMTTSSPVTAQTLCIDVSIFPVNEQTGAVVFLSLYGIQACPLTNSGSGAGDANKTDCIDISGFTDEQKAIIVEIIKPRSPCNESTGLIDTVTGKTGTSQFSCFNLSSLAEPEKKLVTSFMMAHGLSPCEASESTTTGPSRPTINITTQGCVDVSGYVNSEERDNAIAFFRLYNISICSNSIVSPTVTSVPDSGGSGGTTSECVDVSQYSDPVERANAIQFLNLYNINICPETSVTLKAEQTMTTGSPALQDNSAGITACVDVSIFPQQEQPGAVLFLSIYGILACPITDSGPGSTNSIQCIDVSEFSQEQKLIIIDIVKPVPPCNGTESEEPSRSTDGSGTSSTGTILSARACVNISSIADSETDTVLQFMQLHGLQACSSPLATISTATVKPTSECIDVSGYTDLEERARAISFFELYNYTICPDPTSSTTESVTTARSSVTASDTSGRNADSSGITFGTEPCLDVSIFPENERSNAVVFLSIYGILACPLTNSTSSDSNCIDLSGFTDDRRAVIEELIKPALPCNEISSETVADTGNLQDTSFTGDNPNFNGGSSQTQTQSVTLGPADTPVSTTGRPCVNISSYEEQERAAAIEFFGQYGISPCENAVTTAASTTARNCVDLTGVVPALREFVLALNAPLRPCDEAEGKHRSILICLV